MSDKTKRQNIFAERNRSFKTVVFLLLAFSLIVMLACFCVGRFPVSIKELFSLIFGRGDEIRASAKNVLVHIRAPRIFLSYIIGAALSLSGTVYQNLFNNRLVSPGILGVDAGACVGAGIGILLGWGNVLVTVFSFAVGFIAAIMSVGIQKMTKSTSPVVLVLAGVVVSALMNALIGLIKFMADGQNKLASITFWMMGDLSNAEMKHVFYLMPIVLVCSVVLYMMRWRMNAVSLGEKEALSLGINYKRERLIIVMCATLLTSVSVSISGSIGWVGLIIPNVSRTFFKNDTQKLIPVSIFLGGIFMVVVDTLARTLSATEIPLGIITGFLGAIVYGVIIIKRRTNI